MLANLPLESVVANGNRIDIYHRNLINAGEHTFAKFYPEGKLVEQGTVSPSKLNETFGIPPQEFSKINKSGTVMTSLDAGVVETI